MTALSIDVVSSDKGPVLLHVAGELDWGTVETLQLTIERELAKGRAVVLDVRHLEFMDSTGLSALVRAKHSASLLTLDFRVPVVTKSTARRRARLTALRGHPPCVMQ